MIKYIGYDGLNSFDCEQEEYLFQTLKVFARAHHQTSAEDVEGTEKREEQDSSSPLRGDVYSDMKELGG